MEFVARQLTIEWEPCGANSPSAGEIEGMLTREYGASIDAVNGGERWRVLLGEGADPDEVLGRITGQAGIEFAERVPAARGPVDRAKSDADMRAEMRTWTVEPEPTPPSAPPSEIAFMPPPGAARRAAPPVQRRKIAYTVKEHGTWPLECIVRPEEWNELELDNIAVLDSGCDASHPALDGAVDCADEESGADGYGHGTFVAYMIAGRAPNEEMPPGLLPNSKVWVANIFDPQPLRLPGERPQYAVDPNRYQDRIAQLTARETRRLKKIQVVNLSIGFATGSNAERKDMRKLIDSGVIVVAAAGNTPEGRRPDPVMYPAAYPEVISVGALAYSLDGTEIWPRSNAGVAGAARKRAWDICAPGECILSALPERDNALGVRESGWLSGTSMAAPYVTAAVAVLCAMGVKGRDNILERLRAAAGPGFERLVCPGGPHR